MQNSQEIKSARQKVAQAGSSPTNQIRRIRTALDIIDTTVMVKQVDTNPYSEVIEVSPWDESEMQAIKDKILTLMHGL